MCDEVEYSKDVEDIGYLDIIDSQINIITNLIDTDTDMYDKCAEDKVRAISQAYKIIHKVQRLLFKSFDD
jgi:hypothetical protein